ncbi:hypothetical protein A8924_3994 [Saccharopolyspora erythraea NRRL 2338]|uniref:Uncharacterized protein n=1 Tax=Saccharopolyspora erythraea (strain ATCC 11635 / DSM 40517 / JCM 4748 / NBRC 13426 / NCIMB 8594 / NRRL 2338) TaxID=405948 RepID=A4FFP9_SACEN|nr:hypothetical protein N599_26765 [Saccharopolyspora erythraea D]PFG96594.1 hypothetical protein A8924_3994 [Saccharopolyspora erythraea NRRL 2338]CAM02874.1 hypothetical protein SACE_3600 [Saccharopolyspora erythraea NRRL 2338]
MTQNASTIRTLLRAVRAEAATMAAARHRFLRPGTRP